MKIKPLTVCVSIGLLVFSHSSSARLSLSKSNDPEGTIYINKPAGDISNCGPIAALMATKFSQQKFAVHPLGKAIIKARQTVNQDAILQDETEDDESITSNPGNARWWRTRDIKSYLTRNNIRHSSFSITQGERAMLREIDKGNIMIVNLNMNHMPRGFGDIGKPYFTFPIPGGWGHYLVVTGYSYKNGKLLLETHDSFSSTGKNRLYRASNIIKAVKNYNPNVIVVQK